MSGDIISEMRGVSREYVGPIMYEYCHWILHEASQRKIKRIYFLARDGYLLLQIAKIICERKYPETECRYLYCSRASLRMPTYHIIGDEMYDLLLLGGYYLTPKTVLQRGGISEEQLYEILEELSISDENAVLGEAEFKEFSKKVRKSEKYKNAVLKISKASYPAAVGYLRQEGLFECDRVAVADSGWTGSMQRSLRQIMRSDGYTGGFIGFYFGMYSKPNDTDDGEYLTYYFNAKNGAARKALFSNNLFECMLSAPHGMTTGYKYENDRYFPVLTECSNDETLAIVQSQIDTAVKYSIEMETSDLKFNYKKSLCKCGKLLKKIMVYPTRKQVELYGNFLFCDDVTEKYHLPLAACDSSLLEDYLFIVRVFRKVFHIKSKRTSPAPLWIYGTIAFQPRYIRWWYRANVYVWEWLRNILR